MVQTKETVVNIWANKNADSHICEFVLKGDEDGSKLQKLIDFTVAAGGIIKTAEWFIEKECKSKSFGGNLQYPKEKPYPSGTVNLSKFIK